MHGHLNIKYFLWLFIIVDMLCMIVILSDNCMLQLVNRVANPLSRWPTGAAELWLK
jgi:hypothetical protein